MGKDLRTGLPAAEHTRVEDVFQHILNGRGMKRLSFSVAVAFLSQGGGDFPASIAIRSGKLKHTDHHRSFRFVYQNLVDLLSLMIDPPLFFQAVAIGGNSAPLPELMDRKKRDIMERKGDKEDENKRQKQQKESSAAAL